MEEKGDCVGGLWGRNKTVERKKTIEKRNKKQKKTIDDHSIQKTNETTMLNTGGSYPYILYAY